MSPNDRSLPASASAFQAGTADHDVTQNIESLLKHIRGTPPFRVLDFGWGPRGRDLESFTKLGHKPVGLDGCEAFVSMAHQLTGCPVLHQRFDSLELPPATFEGNLCERITLSRALSNSQSSPAAIECMFEIGRGAVRIESKRTRY
ncbi:MAG: hypothetical protein Ct9H300mP13_6260 [Gammaproteobacteria bacterium]|nr:MAG: hypothetical protein Ct9H300mP13_6260 [Gammaproteobacteria bacterium]